MEQSVRRGTIWILFIELGKADLPIFMEVRTFHSHVTHAIQQVEDWLLWHEHSRREYLKH